MQKSVKKILIIFFILFSFLSVWAQKPSEILLKADSLFAKSKHTQALQNYESLFKQNFYTPAMLLKMAFVYEAKSKYPQAQYFLSLYFEATNDFSVLEKQQALAEKNNLDGYSLSETSRFWWIFYSYSGYAAYLLLVIALMLLGIQVRISKERKSILYPLLLILTLGSACTVFKLSKPTAQAIVFAPKTFAMEGPSGAADVQKQLTAGSKVRVVEKQDIWVKVNLNDKLFYVREDALQMIAL